MHRLRSVLLLPLTLPLYAALRVRHWLYDTGILPSEQFDFPVINVGNLQLGGTGKTPMVEFLVHFFLEKGYKTAVLSRGYKRKTKGYVLADKHVSVEQTGDEPYQIWRKFGHRSGFCLAVSEDRKTGIYRLRQACRPDVIILDDAFQHRRIRAGLNIILTPFHRPFHRDFLFPAGRLRDLKSRARQADMVVVTKTPPDREAEKERLHRELSRYSPEIYFAGIRYLPPANETGSLSWESLRDKKVLVITGIADPAPLLDFIKNKNLKFVSLNFSDHAGYGSGKADKIKRVMNKEKAEIILTTEKDFYKLSSVVPFPVYYIPIHITIDNHEKFIQKILTYVNT